jgi:hypothetical protein
MAETVSVLAESTLIKSVPSGVDSSGLNCPAEIKYALYDLNRERGLRSRHLRR